jgi:hypothetical protein
LGGAVALIFWQPVAMTVAWGRWDWEVFTFSFGLTVAIFLLVHGCSIVVGQDGVAYKRLFVWSRFLPYSSIKELRIETHFPAGRNAFKPAYSLIITPHTRKERPLTINIKLFSRNGLSTLMGILSAKAPTAHLDKRCERMEEGFMPSLLIAGDEKKLRSRSRILNFLLKDR